VKIRYHETPQMKLIREVGKNNEDARKLAECFNHWSDDDSWGGSFGNTEFTPQKVYDEWLNAEIITRLAIEKEDKIQGYCTVDGHWLDEDTAYVSLLGVSPHAQKQGFGKTLLLSALKVTIDAGKRRLDLHTWAGNLRAVPVYKKTGFMWCPKTAVLMENYLPAILTTEYFESFFSKNDFYKTRQMTVTQAQDEFELDGVKSYFYRFVQDENNSLEIFIDRHAKDISGFKQVTDGKELYIRLVPNKHEVYLAMENTSAVLKVKNSQERAIDIKGKIRPFKSIQISSGSSIDIIVKPGEEISIPLEIKLSENSETYTVDQEPWRRTDCRIIAELSINGSKCQLTAGWVPMDAIQVEMIERSIYFGINTEKVLFPLGFRNITSRFLEGKLIIRGEGIKEFHETKFELDPGKGSEAEIRIDCPRESIVKAWKWDMRFLIKTENGLQKLPLVSRHVSCFTGAGAVAYVNKNEKAIIENEQLRFVFERTEACGLTRIDVRGQDFYIPIQALEIHIGKPFPDESSEFWGQMEKPFEVVKIKNGGVALKQEFFSEKEKPGLKITRWIEVYPGKPLLNTYYEFTNTNEASDIVDVGIQYWTSWSHRMYTLRGKLILPLKSGTLVVDDDEFNDSYDFPRDPTAYAEQWIAIEPHGNCSPGLGIIWKDEEVDKVVIAPSGFSRYDSKSYTIKPGEKVRTGHLMYTIGYSAAKLAKNTWISEMTAGNSSSESSLDTNTKLIGISIGEDLAGRIDIKNPYSSIRLMNIDSQKIPLSVDYNSSRPTPVEIEVEIESKLFNERKNWKVAINAEDKTSTVVLVDNLPSSNTLELVEIDNLLKLPYTERRFQSVAIPYRKSGSIILEKENDYWLYDNGVMSFKSSPSHGASLCSAVGNSEELFYSKYPNKGAYSWYKMFVGGISPYIAVPNVWEFHEFYGNIWTEPELITNNGWYGLHYKLDSPENDFRLGNLHTEITYFTRPESPLLWADLSITNKSGSSALIEGGISVFLNPINELMWFAGGKFIKGTKTTRERFIVTRYPHDWLIADFSDNIKLGIASCDNSARISGMYMNALDYSVFQCIRMFKLDPGQSDNTSLLLIASDSITPLKTCFRRNLL